MLNPETSAQQIAILNAHAAFILFDEQGKTSSTLRLDATSNGGKSWRSTLVSSSNGAVSTDITANSIDAISTMDLYSLVGAGDGMNSPNGWLLRSSNAGRTWSVVSASGSKPFGLPSALGIITFTNSENGWLVARPTTTGTASLYRTTDGGRRWKVSTPVDRSTKQRLVPLDTPRMFSSTSQWQVLTTSTVNGTVGSTCRIFVSSESAPTQWSESGTCGFALNAIGEVNSPFFLSASRGWEWSDGKLFITIDGGKRWNNLSSATNMSSFRLETISTLEFTDRAHGWMLLHKLSGTSTFLVTSNGGRTWRAA